MKMEEQLEYVGFWRRVLASIIDGILFGMVSLPLLLAFYGKAYLSSENFIEGPIDFLVSLLPLCLGFLWVAFDSKKQGWHDKIAGTVVIGPKKKTEDVRFTK